MERLPLGVYDSHGMIVQNISKKPYFVLDSIFLAVFTLSQYSHSPVHLSYSRLVSPKNLFTKIRKRMLRGILQTDIFCRASLPLFILYFILIALVLPIGLTAQHVPGTKWKQRETKNFFIIYPESLSDDAAALSLVLDEVYKTVSIDLQPKNRKKKWPLILTDLGLQPNGYVSLMPRRSIWYATPGEDFTAVSDWWMLLARHEGRHMAQFDAADQGLTHVLRILFGDIGWGAGIIFGSPRWLLEGDAVYQETVLSEEGRGRDPLFTQEMAAIAIENPDFSYHQLVNPSFKEHHPSVYHLGYAFTSWIYQQYGAQAMKEIYKRTARIGLPVIAIDVAMLKATGKHPRTIFKEMIQNLAVKALRLKESGSWTDAQFVSQPNKEFTRYDSLFIDQKTPGEHIIFARRTTSAVPSELIRLSDDGSMKSWIRLPSGGRVSMSPLEISGKMRTGYRLVWNALRYHPVYKAASVSDFTVVDLNADGDVIRRFHPVIGSRYLYPGLSPDGQYIAAVDMGQENGNRVVVLDAESGKIIRELPLDESSAAYPSWSPAGDKIVFTVRSRAGRRVAEWLIEKDQPHWLTPLSWETVKNPVYSSDGQGVVYSSNTGGIEALWLVSTDTLNMSHLARRWYSASRPSISPDGQWVYCVEYTSSRGERLIRVPFTNTAVVETPSATAQLQESLNPVNSSKIIAKGNNEHPESHYKPGAHTFNIHSWGFDIDRNYSQIIKFNIRSQDLLNTMAWEIGTLYDTNEISPGAYASLAYTGIRPIIALESTYKRRFINTDNPLHHVLAMASAYYPMNLSRNGIWNHELSFYVSGGVQWSDTSSVSPLMFYNVQWHHLRNGSDRAFWPELGWIFKGTYAHIPLADNVRDSIAGELDFYLPGGFRNTFLILRGGIERQTDPFTSLTRSARGYAWQSPYLNLLTSVDYEFPLAYPDMPIGAVFSIQRLRMGVHSDFVWLGESDVFSTGDFVPQWSTGISFTIDFAAFNNFSGISLGMDFNWLWQSQTWAFDIMLKGLPIF